MSAVDRVKHNALPVYFLAKFDTS